MVDESAVIRAHGLDPNERITIQAELVDRTGASWVSRADFIADGQGTVDASKQAPSAGSYHELSPMGLIWSMRPTAKDVNVYMPPEHFDPQTIRFELLCKGAPVSTAELQQVWLADGIRQIKLEGALHGVLFEPAIGPHPGVLVLGGSEGGAPLRPAMWLASHGYAALALPYFRYEGLPQKLQAIPLEYFGQALAWMKTRSEILSDHIGVMGTSRGGELALQLGAMYPSIKTVVAFVPANTRHGACCGNTNVRYAWTWKGLPLVHLLRPDEHDPAVIMQATIDVEHTHGPILVISGTDDKIWDSTSMADAVVARLKQSHFPYPFEHLSYPHAGHRAGHPAITPAWHGTVRHPVSGKPENYGGSAEGDALSTLDAIPKVLQFLERGLADSQ